MLTGQKILFEDVNLLIGKPGKYGVVGANGAGKSTLFKLLSKAMVPTTGEIILNNSLSIGWLNQDHFKFDDEIILNVVLRGNQKLWQALQEKDALLQQENFDEDAANRLGELEETIQHENGYVAESMAERLLIGLGIRSDYHYETLSVLSGGYKIRVLLAQALFNNPDILMLDEPTNHLDIITTQWLENYLLQTYQGVLLFISHDQDFLNNLANYIIDLDFYDIQLYHGNYVKFCEQKSLKVSQQEQLALSAKNKIAHMQQFVDKFKAKASKAKQAQSRMKMIDKVAVPDQLITNRVAPIIHFNLEKTSGKNVLQVKNLCHAYGEAPLYKNLSFNLHRNDKVVIIGQNGIGKSTLVKQLVGLITSNETVTWGHGVKVAYFSQDHHEQLNSSITVFAWLKEQVVNVTESEIRRVLGQLLFTKEQVNKNILTLSGGEAARLLLANIILSKPNVLVFDEPTNHLDLEAIAAFQNALIAFPGTVIVVSHNRHFINAVATRVLAMTANQMVDYLGSYHEFLDRYGEEYFASSQLI